MTARILVVDDVSANRRLLEAKLNTEFYEVALAEDGPTALQRVRDWNPDVVLLDVMMPGMDGLEVLRHVRAEPQWAALPVVMFSAVSDPQFREHAMNKGATDYWVKASISYDELQRRLTTLLG